MLIPCMACYIAIFLLSHLLYSQDTTLWRYITAQSKESNPMDKAEQMFRSSCLWREDIQLVERIYPEWRGCNATPTHRHQDAHQDTNSALANTETTTAAGITDINMEKDVKYPRATSARARFGDLIYHGGLLSAPCCISGAAPGGPVLLERLGKIDLPGIYADACEFRGRKRQREGE